MSKKITDYLAYLGLSAVEAKVYLILLRTGNISIRDVAKKADIKRTTIYLHIDRLQEKGLVKHVIHGSKILLSATEPQESLWCLVQKETQTAKSLEAQFPQIIEALKAEFPDSTNCDQEIAYYPGKNQARRIYEDALRASELRTFVYINKTNTLFPNNARVFSTAFKKNKKLKIWELVYDSEVTTGPSKSSRLQVGRYFYKYLPKNIRLTSEDILIYDGKVAIINYRDKRTNIVLKSTDFYNNLKELFDFIWTMLPDPETNTA